MDREVIPHKTNFHPEIPSFRDEYKQFDSEVVSLAYKLVFNPTRSRYVTGGIATQFHGSSKDIRGSDDIDVTDLERTNWGELEGEIMKDLKLCTGIPYIPGYDLVFERRNHSIVIHICNWFIEPEDSKKHYFDVCFPRHSNGHHKKMLPTFEREFGHSHSYFRAGAEILVLDPVDIINRKVNRVFNYYKWEGIPKYRPPTSIEKQLSDIWKQRKKLFSMKEHIEKEDCDECVPEFNRERTFLRAMCDSYDIRVLWDLEEFNDAYFEEVFKENETQGKDRAALEKLLKELCPEFFLE